MEAVKVPSKRVDRVVHILFRKRGVGHKVYRQAGRWGPGCTEEGLKSVVTADVVRDGVGDLYVLETTGGDLKIIFWVAPTPETVFGVIGKDGGMVKVCGIYFGGQDWYPMLLA